MIDIQNDYFIGGNLELYQMEPAADQAKKILKFFRNANLPIFHIQHISTLPSATFFVPNTDGVEINERVFPQPNEKVISVDACIDLIAHNVIESKK